jgi:hypothetical protein
MMSLGVFSWWSALCVVGALNILAWSGSAVQLARRRDLLAPEVLTARRLQLLLSAVYVFGCAFRSAVPVFDVPRLCLVDSWISRVIVGRSVATVAELCFVGQWALLLYASSRSTGSRLGRVVALGLVPLIAIAEVCSWYSVLTTSNLGHFAEESIWALCGVLLVLSLVTILRRSAPARRPVLILCCAAGAAYVAFMVLIDIPMYWSRWLADEASGRHYLSIAQGLHDVSSRWVVSHRWQDWKSEMPWMSLYFSVAVWISISLVRVPVPAGYAAPRDRQALRAAAAC